MFLLTIRPFLIAAAVLPALILLIYVYRKDRLEQESRRMLRGLLLQGIIATALAGLAERVGSAILGYFLPENSVLYSLIFYFLVVGVAEEGFKYALLVYRTWESPEFNCSFDGVVYAVFVSLGFALWENIDYVLAYGFGTALLRAVTAVPGHACFGVFMGAFYSLAKKYHVRGYGTSASACRVLAFLVPAFLHGLYDFVATLASYGADTVFFGFVIILFLVSFRLVKKLSARDEYLTGGPMYF